MIVDIFPGLGKQSWDMGGHGVGFSDVQDLSLSGLLIL